MFKSKIILFSLLAIILASVCFGDFSEASETRENCICLVYITGVGCPNCAVTDPVVLSEWTLKYPNLVAIEYEIYENNEENYPTADEYFENYISSGVRPGIPFLILDKDNVSLGRFEVLEAEKRIENLCENKLPLPDNSCQKFEDLDINNLPGKPNIWVNGRVLTPVGEKKADDELLKKLLFEDDILSVLEGLDYTIIVPELVSFSNGEVNFDNALLIDGWRFQWNGEGLDNSLPINATALAGLSNKINWSKIFYSALIIIFVLIFITSVYKKKKSEPAT